MTEDKDATIARLQRELAEAQRDKPRGKDMADWSGLPDVYVTNARLVDGIFWEVTACSVPMAIGPEVRLIRADKAEAERDALIGAAFEAAARAAFNAIAKYPLRTMLTNTDNATMLELAILALTPAEATAALATVRAEAEKAGMLEAAGMVQAEVDQAKQFGPHHIPVLASVRKAIIAAAEKGPSS